MKELDSIYLVEVNKLRIHPFNSKIYSDCNDETFDKDIKENGIRSPITINKNNEILDGARRFTRAIKYKISKIPAIVRDYKDEELAIVMLNKYRQKTPRELFMEAQVLKKKYSKVIHDGKAPLPETGIAKGTTVQSKVSDDIGISKGKLVQLEKVYNNEDKIPNIVKALDEGTLSVNKAAQAADLVLKEGVDEDKIVKDMLRSEITMPSVHKKRTRARSMSKVFYVKCPYCSQLLFSDKRVNLTKRESKIPEL